MAKINWKDLWKVGVFTLVLSVASTLVSYGMVATIQWIQEGGISDLKEKIEEKRKAKKAAKYATKTIES